VGTPSDMGPLAKFGYFAAVFPVLSAALFGVWWFFGHVAQAEGDHNEQVVLAEVVKGLAAIHLKIDTVEEAEAAQIVRLCMEGKLDAVHCPPIALPSYPRPTTGASR